MRKRALGFAFTLASVTSVVAACSSDDDANPSNPGDDGGRREDASSPSPDGGSGGSNADGSDDADGDSGGNDAPEVSLTFGNCPDFTPCGGNPEGTWQYAAGGCIDDFQTEQCKTLTVKSSDIKIRGTVKMNAGALVRNVETSVTAKIHVPAECKGKTSCALVAVGLTTLAPLDSATCVEAGDGCDCDVAAARTDQSETTYTVDGNTITTGDSKTHDFCVDESATVAKLKYTDKLSGVANATLVMEKK